MKQVTKPKPKKFGCSWWCNTCCNAFCHPCSCIFMGIGSLLAGCMLLGMPNMILNGLNDDYNLYKLQFKEKYPVWYDHCKKWYPLSLFDTNWDGLATVQEGECTTIRISNGTVTMDNPCTNCTKKTNCTCSKNEIIGNPMTMFWWGCVSAAVGLGATCRGIIDGCRLMILAAMVQVQNYELENQEMT